MAKVKWSADCDRQVAELLACFDTRKDSQPFAGLSAEEIDSLKRLSFAEWIRKFLPDWFPAQVPDAPFHAEADARRNTLGIPVGNCWFGGAGKTARYVIADAVYDICAGIYYCQLADGSALVLPYYDAIERADVISKVRIILEVNGARNIRKAAEKNRIIRLILKHSPELKAVYGDAILPTEGEDAEVDFTANGVKLLAMGIEQSLRGTIYAGHRVQKVRLDDVENNEIAASKEREDKLEDQLFLDWYPRCEGGGQEAIFTCQMNQYRSHHCLARRFKRMASEFDEHGNPKAWFHVVPMDDGEFHSAWPGRYPDAAVKRLHFQIGPLRFDIECRCREVNEESLIQLEWFVPYRRSALAFPAEDRWVFAACLDPSATEKETSDYKAIVAGGKRVAHPEIFVLHAWARKLATPEEMLLHLIGLRTHLPGVYLGAESVGFQRLCWNLLVLLCDRDGIPVPRIWAMPSQGAKWDRIYENIAELARGVVHVDATEGQQQMLIDQLVEGPTGKHDDLADAYDMMRRLLTRAERAARSAEPQPEPTRADLLREAGIDKWNVAENPAIWQEAEI
jgi:hypothetical protein